MAWIAEKRKKSTRVGKKVFEIWADLGFEGQNFRDFWPFSRGRFEAVGPHFRCDFIGAMDVTRRDLFIAAIKSHQKCGPTGSKMHFLKGRKFSCVVAHEADFGDFEGRFWACWYRTSVRFYCRNEGILSFYVDCINKIAPKSGANSLKNGPRNRQFSLIAVFGIFEFDPKFSNSLYKWPISNQKSSISR